MTEVEPDGTLHVEGFDLPPSAGWSDEARKVFLKRFSGPPVSAQSIRGRPDEESWLASSKAFRASMEKLHRRLLDPIREAHPCDVREDLIAGVRVQWVTPRSGVPGGKTGRVLVNLHGGAFIGGGEFCGLVESLPVADIGGYRICVVDYRQGWEHRFPAASEDVAAVVQTLQSDVAPSSIGIFGYSAGGALTAQSVAWMIDRGIPLPGAVAICTRGPEVAATPVTSPIGRWVSPSLHSTRARAMHRRALLGAGTTAELHVWEGMWHCFPYNHRMPEAKDAFRTITRFFDRHLE